MQFKKIAQIFVSILLFGSLGSIKAMDSNSVDFESLPNEMTLKILQYIANSDSIENVSQANILDLKKMVLVKKDDFQEYVTEILEKLKNSTDKYLNQFLGDLELLIKKAMELNTEFSQFYIKCLNSNPNSGLAKKLNENFMKIFKLMEDKEVTCNTLIKKIGFLINAGVDPNLQEDIEKNTLLILASINGKKNIVKFLLGNNKTDINRQNKNGKTALRNVMDMLALHKKEHKDIVKILLDNNADPNIRDKGGLTVLEKVAVLGYKDIARLLISNDKTNLNFQNSKGNTALMELIKFKIILDDDCKDVAKLLISNNKTDLNIKNKKGQTALQMATKKGHKYIVDLINQYSVKK